MKPPSIIPNLFLLVLLLPVLEIFVFLLMSSRIGVLYTIAIIILAGIAGATVAKSQGLRALKRYQQAIEERRLPHEEVLDGLLVFFAGVALLLPGFLSDIVALLILLPWSRRIIKDKITRSLKQQVDIAATAMTGSPLQPTRNSASGHTITVEAEIIDSSPETSEPTPRSLP